MTQRYNVPAIHTATFPATLTENLSHSSQSCRDIFNAADRRPQTADRRPQTADRRPPLNYFFSIAVFLAIAVMTNTPIKAQAWTCTSPGFPNGNAGCGAPGTATWLGYVGIRTNVPAKPLHIYSGFCAEPAAYDPAVARLQTNAANYGFGQSSIQFWSGGLGIQDWHVGAIKPITGVNPYSAFPSIFNTANPLSPADWKGGLAFFCSGTGQQPTEFNDIEVMRVVDDKVGIRTKDPLGQLDVNVGDAAAKPKVSITNGTSPHLDDTYGGPQLRFYIPYNNVDSPADRSSSYSWYLHAMRQYDPACFLGLDGTQGSTWENTTLGALHFMAGYNTASHAAGDIYRDNKGSETAIPRMSLLSNGNVGINNVIPMTRFQVSDGAVLFDGTQGDTPKKRYLTPSIHSDEIGEGTRLMWIPSKAAFRAGIVGSDQWNSYNIGYNSAAFGSDNLVSGDGSFAGGYTNFVGGITNTAFGQNNSILEATVPTGPGKKYYFPSTLTAFDYPSNSITVGDYNQIYQNNSAAFGTLNNLLYRYDGLGAGGSPVVAANDYNSFAFGTANEVAGACSAAFGWQNSVYGLYAFAAGKENVINSLQSTNINIGFNATALGCHNIANGMASTVMGNESKAYGSHSVAIGYYAQAGASETTQSLGEYTYAIGNHLTSNANNSTTMGNYVESLASHSGSFLVGDNSTTTNTQSSRKDQITLRFSGDPDHTTGGHTDGAYRFYTKNDLSTGMYMLPSTSGWSAVSDRNAKENFKEIEGTQILERIERMPASEWNYKGIPGMRYIGPMAQDFYREFHLGNDSLGINSINIDGVNMAGVQALYQRSKAQAAEIQTLKNTVAAFENSLSDIALLKEGMLAQAKTMAEIQQQNTDLRNRLTIVETVLNKCCTTAPGSPFGDKLHETNPSDQTIVDQNAPNPFTELTTISFSVPATVKNAHIVIEQIGGTEMKRLPITSRGNGSIELNSENIPSGVYLYYLSADGVPTGGRKMIIIK